MCLDKTTLASFQTVGYWLWHWVIQIFGPLVAWSKTFWTYSVELSERNIRLCFFSKFGCCIQTFGLTTVNQVYWIFTRFLWVWVVSLMQCDAWKENPCVRERILRSFSLNETSSQVPLEWPTTTIAVQSSVHTWLGWLFKPNIGLKYFIIQLRFNLD